MASHVRAPFGSWFGSSRRFPRPEREVWSRRMAGVRTNGIESSTCVNDAYRFVNARGEALERRRGRSYNTVMRAEPAVILVVEDDPEIRGLVCALLGRAGFRAEVAEDAVSMDEVHGRVRRVRDML